MPIRYGVSGHSIRNPYSSMGRLRLVPPRPRRHVGRPGPLVVRAGGLRRFLEAASATGQTTPSLLQPLGTPGCHPADTVGARRMGRDTWSGIVPDGLWDIATPLIPPPKVRRQCGGTQDTPDETLFASRLAHRLARAAELVPPAPLALRCCGVLRDGRRVHRRQVSRAREGLLRQPRSRRGGGRRQRGSGALPCQSVDLAGSHGSCHRGYPATSLLAPAGPQVPCR